MRGDEVIEWYSAILNKERERSAELAGALGAMAQLCEIAADYIPEIYWKLWVLEKENIILRSVNHEREKDRGAEQNS